MVIYLLLIAVNLTNKVLEAINGRLINGRHYPPISGFGRLEMAQDNPIAGAFLLQTKYLVEAVRAGI